MTTRSSPTSLTPPRIDAVDDALVDALCREVADLPGEATEVVRSRVGSVAPLLHGSNRDRLVDAAVARLVGLDRLDALMNDPDVDEILVNRGGDVWVERHGSLVAATSIPAASIPVVLERILAPLGRRLDRTSPMVDARLPDGSRVCAVIPPIAVDGTTIAIRRFQRRLLPIDRFGGTAVTSTLRDLIERRANVLVVGGTSSGKTSLLGALLGLVPAHERVVLIEDTAELATSATHVVRLEARAAVADGPPAITLGDLVRTALRLRPDRLVVGEVRGPEVLALVQAMNTGHDGSLSSCHASGVTDAIVRLETLVLQAAPSWPLGAIRAQLTRSIDAIVKVSRTSSSARRVDTIAEVVEGDGPPRVTPLVAEGEMVARPTRSRGT